MFYHVKISGRALDTKKQQHQYHHHHDTTQRTITKQSKTSIFWRKGLGLFNSKK
jgi:hypothetical protein